MSTDLSTQLRGDSADRQIVDSDLHVYPPEEDALEPFLPERFRGKGVSYPDGNWASPVGPFREDVSIGEGSEVATEHLDPLGIDRAVVTGSRPVFRVGSGPDRRYAAALTSAYNDWLLEERLSADDRLRGSIAVAPVAPEAAAEEVRRLGDHPAMVQVVMGAATQVALGEERYWPVYEAAVEHGLPVAIHAGGEGYGLAHANTGAGYPSTYLEAHSVRPANFMGQLLSLVLEGAFVEFPDLRVVMVGGGYSWVPSFLWRIDKMWKGLTEDVPWLERPPSQYVREHVRFVTYPIDESGDAERTGRMLEMLHAEDTLMFGSNYPHWESYAPGEPLPELDPSLTRAIFAGTATELYDL
ncbi:MAG: amidohydrolase family protein [Haloarculaceae archaeon]